MARYAREQEAREQELLDSAPLVVDAALSAALGRGGAGAGSDSDTGARAGAGAGAGSK